MITEEKKQILQALEDYLSKHEMSANQFAQKCGVSASYISNMRQGIYSYDAGNGKLVEISDKYFKQIAEFVGLSMQKTYWDVKPTAQLKNILATLEDAQKFGYTNVIIGETGSGKTYAVKMFEKANPKDFFLITVGQSDNLGDLIERIIEKIRINDIPRSKSGKLRAIAAKMREMKMDGLNPVLCFDEAEYMKQPALAAMKELYDALNNICAIQMIGTDQLIKKIENLKKRNKDGMPQLYRRIKFGVRRLPSIDRTFKEFLNGFEKPLKTFLQNVCDNYGELHDVLVPAMREADRTGEQLSEGFIRKVLNMPNY